MYKRVLLLVTNCYFLCGSLQFGYPLNSIDVITSTIWQKMRKVVLEFDSLKIKQWIITLEQFSWTFCLISITLKAFLCFCRFKFNIWSIISPFTNVHFGNTNQSIANFATIKKNLLKQNSETKIWEKYIFFSILIKMTLLYFDERYQISKMDDTKEEQDEGGGG